MPAGLSSVPPLPPRQRALGSTWGWWTLPTRRRTARPVGRASRTASASAPLSVPPAGWCSTATTTRPATLYGPGRPVGERWDHPPCCSEHLRGCSPCGVSISHRCPAVLGDWSRSASTITEVVLYRLLAADGPLAYSDTATGWIVALLRSEL